MQKPVHPSPWESSTPAAATPGDAQTAARGPGRSLAWGRGAGAASLFALILFIIFFQWNWLRGPLALWLSGKLDRPVAIAGDLSVHPWSGRPWAVVRGLSVGQPAWAPRGAMVEAPALTVQWRWGPLLTGRAVLPLVRIERPSLDLRADASGRHDWDFGAGGPASSAGRPIIGRLIITAGRVGLHDAEHGVDFAGTLASNETAGAGAGSRVEGALTVAGAPWAGPAPLVHAPRLVIEAGLLDALAGHLSLPLIEADAPSIRAVRDAGGRESWRRNDSASPVKLPPIGRLVISNGAVAYDDAKADLTFRGRISSREALAGQGGPSGAFQLEGRGALNRQPFSASVTGGALVRVSHDRPYPFRARIQAGPTHIDVAAAFLHPFDFTQVAGRGSVGGPDFADLYRLTGVALPSTPPYALSAGFARSGETWAFRRIAGRVGVSDLAGSVTASKRAGRPFVAADLASRRLLLSDLAAVIGGVPARTAGRPLSPTQQATAARLRAEHRVLPDAHLDLARLRASDAALTYRAASVDAGKLPIRALSMKLALNRGLLTIDPLSMSLPQGVFAGSIRLDGRGPVPAEAVDFRLAGARLENFLGRSSTPAPLSGGLAGRARLSATGDSVRAAAAHANGAVSLVIPGGEIRQAFAELLGIDATKGLFLLLAKNHGSTPIRCAVADFDARDGVFTARRIVLDTGVVLAKGGGDIDLRDESLHLSLSGKPKKFRLVRIGAPITLGGDLAQPKVGVSIGKALPQFAASAVLGAVVAPLAVIAPFITAGLTGNADCAALLRQSPGAAAGGALPVRR